MDKGRKQRVEETGGGETYANSVDDQRPIEVLQDNSSAITGDPDCFDELHQVVPEENYVGALARDISSCTHCDSNGRFA
jgi:hypothetical protein